MPNNLKVRFGIACAALALTTMSSAVRAEEGVAIKNLLGQMGVIPRDKDPIRYRERAPLVIPPKMELREPAAPESYASNNPQWPKDPDVMAKRRRAAEEATPVTSSEIRRMSERNPMLSQSELRDGRDAQANNGFKPKESYNGNGWDVLMMKPEEGKVSKREDDASPAVRRTLAEPPTGYRNRTAAAGSSPSYDPKIDQQQADANPINWLTRKFHRSDDDD